VNLVVNARDAMRPADVDDRHREPRSRRSSCGVAPRLAIGPYARLRVSDTGEGMEQLVLDHIFEPFFTTKPEAKVPGLASRWRSASSPKRARSRSTPNRA